MGPSHGMPALAAKARAARDESTMASVALKTWR